MSRQRNSRLVDFQIFRASASFFPPDLDCSILDSCVACCPVLL